MNVVSARAAALRILAARHACDEAPRSTVYTLAEFQQEAVTRALAIMRQRGGVIVADSVGLGKTYIGAALAERVLDAQQAIAVVIPASLRTTWRRALAPLSARAAGTIDFVTHGQLSRGLQAARSYELVLVDEAHAFRNPHTRRYRALRRLTRAGQVALLTATPVNNSLADLYFQLRLFAADDAFTDLGIGSLSALLRGADVDANALARLRDAVIIRRTRAQLRSRFSVIGLPDGRRLRFPATVRLANVRHAPLAGTADVVRFIESTELAVYRSEVTATLVGLSLLKRLQSSRHAFLLSIDRLVAFHERFLTALAQGRLLQARTFVGHEQQLCFTEILLSSVPPELSVPELHARVQLDLEGLRAFRRRIAGTADAKLPRLVELLSARPPPKRTVIFTEFRDTAEYLWRNLHGRFQTGLVTGSAACLGGDRCARAEVIRRFAPVANHWREPGAQESVFVLIATDVLAEGLNLQDADAVVSYDLPWNPVRLIQRAGRIDRIGSPHQQVMVFNFMPDREFDELLGLVRRLRDKLRGLRCAVGQEAPVLDSDELTASFYQDLAAGPSFPEPAPPLDLSGAAPEGALASTARLPSRVLVCWQTGTGPVRELIIQDGRPLDDKQLIEEIIERALASSCMEASPAVAAAVEASRAYLPTATRQSHPDRETIILVRAIQRAVQVYGVLAGPDLLEEAEQVLAQVRGNVFEPRQLAAVRAARTPAELKNALQEIRLACRPVRGISTAKWRLIAAIGSD